MEIRRIGRTEIEVPVLGLGGIPLASISVEEGIPLINAAFDAGIKFIDTARGYNTEPHFGAVLKDRRDKDGIVVATKSPRRRADQMRADIETSLKELQVEMIDIYQCHAIPNEEALDEVLGPGGALEAIRKAQSEGLVRFAGITSHRYEVLEKAIKTNEFDTVMVQFSFIDDQAQEKTIPLAEEYDLGILVMKAFAGGVIDRAGPALKYVLQYPVSVVPVGMSKMEELEDNLRVARGSMAMSEEEERYIQQKKKETEGLFCRRCGYCMPCEHKVPIPQVLSFKMIYGRLGWKDSFLKWLELAEQCEGCRECESKCPYELPISELIPKMREEMRTIAQRHTGG